MATIVVERFPRAVEEVRATLVVDRCRRNTGLDQLDPSPIQHPVVGRRGDDHGPTEVMGDAQVHAPIVARTEPFDVAPRHTET